MLLYPLGSFAWFLLIPKPSPDIETSSEMPSLTPVDEAGFSAVEAEIVCILATTAFSASGLQEVLKKCLLNEYEVVGRNP